MRVSQGFPAQRFAERFAEEKYVEKHSQTEGLILNFGARK